jgi:hypothetical protein
MLVGTFNGPGALAGKKVTLENGQYIVEGQGPISVEAVVTYEVMHMLRYTEAYEQALDGNPQYLEAFRQAVTQKPSWWSELADYWWSLWHVPVDRKPKPLSTVHPSPCRLAAQSA